MLRIEIEMLALAIPWLLIVLLLVNIVLLTKKRWCWSLLVFVCIIVLNRRFECVPLRLWNSTEPQSEWSLRVVSFNIDGTNGELHDKAEKIRNLLHECSPNIIFIAEFVELHPAYLDSVLREEFAYTTYANRFYSHYFYGTTPLFNISRLEGKDGKKIGVYTCSTIVDGDTIDIYGCHFASNNYDKKENSFSIDEVNNYEGIKDYLSNIGSSCNRRANEAEALVKAISMTHHPVILMGDLNDVCGSRPLRVLDSAGLSDVWWEKGIGYGATIHHPLPFRIDHIMHTEDLKVKDVKAIASDGISDHEALYAEFEF